MEFPDMTNEQKERLDLLYGNDFKGVTPDDIPLIIAWERHDAVNDAEFQNRQQLLREELETRLEASKKAAQESYTRLQELHDAAMNRYKAVEYGKTEQK